MKVPIFYGYTWDHLGEAEFRFRFGGLWFTFICARVDGEGKRIRRARALLIRGTVVTAQSGHCWKLNNRGTKWAYCTPDQVASISSDEVYWALSDSRNVVETWQHGRLIRWKVIRKVGQCYHCDTPCEVKYAYGGPEVTPAVIERGKLIICTCVCKKCREHMKEVWIKCNEKKFKVETMYEWWDLLRRKEIFDLASQERSGTIRWVRKFTAEGSFTSSEFRRLCERYANVCLRCRRKKQLVADHVIPLAKGGRNDITNIQPLCKTCNGRKGVNLTDYRKKWRN